MLKQQPSLIDITKSEAEMIDCKETLELALSAMKHVTEMVNEGMYIWSLDWEFRFGLTRVQLTALEHSFRFTNRV